MSGKILLVCFILSLITVTSVLPVDNSACNDVSSPVCNENVGFIKTRDFKNDFSVAYSHYIAINMTTYEEKVSIQELEYSNTILPDPVPFLKEGKELVKHIEDEKLKEALSTSLGDISTFNPAIRSNFYVIYAAIDLMNYHYTKIDPSGKVWKFSADQLIEECQDQVNDIKVIMSYLLTQGVCEMDDYEYDASSCRHYLIDGVDYMFEDITNDYIYELLQKGPLYVEVGLHPMYFQFYSPNCEDPVHAGYTRPSYAGVLTGYDFTEEGQEYWEMYIRRHGENYNNVKIAAKFYGVDAHDNVVPKHPFAGLPSKMFQMTVNAIHPVVIPIIPAFTEGQTLITDDASLLSAVQEIYTEDTGAIKTLAAYGSMFDLTETTEFDLFSNFPALDEFILILDGESVEDINLFINAFANFEGTLSFPSQEDFETMHGISSTRRLEEVTIVNSADLGEAKTIAYKELKLSNLRMGNNLFHNTPYNVHIENCPKLKSVTIGNNSFNYGIEFVLRSNHALASFVVGNKSFGGKPVIMGSSVTMEDLPKLTYVEFGNNAFANVYSVNTISFSASVTYMDIHGDKAFENLQEYESRNVHVNIDDYFLGKTPDETVTQTPEPPSEEPELNVL